ncbi:MAG TPA: NlpC/P60 family protein [Rhodothermales bacterium]|nr:NlpC/P60 family protein [Rhodothermales bacterium]
MQTRYDPTYRTRSPLVLGMVLGVSALILSGCAGSKHVAQRPSKAERPAVAPRPAPVALEPAVWTVPGEAVSAKPEAAAGAYVSADDRIREDVEGWIGTPHRMGGTTHDGVDCSAFVQAVYQDVFDIRLPRTTVQQATVGRKISPDELRPGDLVFFHPSRSNHVGIYLSNGEFAHASESRGVIISKFDQPYWQRSYWTARRVLQGAVTPAGSSAAHPPASPAEANATSETPISSHTGW